MASAAPQEPVAAPANGSAAAAAESTGVVDEDLELGAGEGGEAGKKKKKKRKDKKDSDAPKVGAVGGQALGVYQAQGDFRYNPMSVVRFCPRYCPSFFGSL